MKLNVNENGEMDEYWKISAMQKRELTEREKKNGQHNKIHFFLLKFVSLMEIEGERLIWNE